MLPRLTRTATPDEGTEPAVDRQFATLLPGASAVAITIAAVGAGIIAAFAALPIPQLLIWTLLPTLPIAASCAVIGRLSRR